MLSAGACGYSNAAFSLLPSNILLSASSCGCTSISLEYPKTLNQSQPSSVYVCVCVCADAKKHAGTQKNIPQNRNMGADIELYLDDL